MDKKIVVLTGSPRKKGNSIAMTEAFIAAAQKKGQMCIRDRYCAEEVEQNTSAVDDLSPLTEAELAEIAACLLYTSRCV